MKEICGPPEACKDCSGDGDGSCLRFSPRGDDDEVFGDAPGKFSQPLPDPFGQTYGIPRLPKEPVQVRLSTLMANSLAEAPAQKVMYESDPTAGADGCIPRVSVATSASAAAASEGAGEDAEKNSNEEKPSCFTPYCPDANRTIDEQELLDGPCWCLYCCCSGVGFGSFVHQRLMLKMACLLCECDEVECFGSEGIFSCIWSCCCVSVLLHVPPRHKTPVFMCCNEMYGLPHHDPKEAEEQERIEHDEYACGENVYNHLITESFTVFYLKIMGCVFSPPPFVNHIGGGWCKCSSIKCQVAAAQACSEEEGCCLGMWTCLWFYWYCRLPPEMDTELNPVFACCGCKPLRHAHHMWHGPGGEVEGPAKVQGMKDLTETAE